MRTLTLITAAAGLLLTPNLGWAGAPTKHTDKAETCSGDFGTSMLFEDSPSDAAAKAKKEGKLLLVLHVSGHFEDPKLT